jgi:hypothetical protein
MFLHSGKLVNQGHCPGLLNENSLWFGGIPGSQKIGISSLNLHILPIFHAA